MTNCWTLYKPMAHTCPLAIWAFALDGNLVKPNMAYDKDHLKYIKLGNRLRNSVKYSECRNLSLLQIDQ